MDRMVAAEIQADEERQRFRLLVRQVDEDRHIGVALAPGEVYSHFLARGLAVEGACVHRGSGEGHEVRLTRRPAVDVLLEKLQYLRATFLHPRLGIADLRAVGADQRIRQRVLGHL